MLKFLRIANTHKTNSRQEMGALAQVGCIAHMQTSGLGQAPPSIVSLVGIQT